MGDTTRRDFDVDIVAMAVLVLGVLLILLLLGRGRRVLQRKELLLLLRSRDDDGAEALSEDRGGVHVPKTKGALDRAFGIVSRRGSGNNGDNETKAATDLRRKRASLFVRLGWGSSGE